MTTETVELPPLPTPGMQPKHWSAQDAPVFTPSELRAYARQAVLAERERIAAEMEAKPDGVWANTCGHGIRRP